MTTLSPPAAQTVATLGPIPIIETFAISPVGEDDIVVEGGSRFAHERDVAKVLEWARSAEKLLAFPSPEALPAGGVIATLIDKTEKLIAAADDMSWSLNSSAADQAISEARDAIRAALTSAPAQEDLGIRKALMAADEVLTSEDACNLDPIVGSDNPHEHAAGLVREALRVRETTRPHPTDPGHWRWRGE